MVWKKPKIKKGEIQFGFAFLIVVIFNYLIARQNFLLFHSFAEGVAIIVATLNYVLASKTYKYSKDSFLLFIGITYLFVAVFDFLHLFTYYEMGVFPHYGDDVTKQLWLVRRLLESISLLLATFFVSRPFKRKLVSGTYLVSGCLLVMSIMYWRIVPVCFIPGQGSTPFKIGLDLVIGLLLVASLIRLVQKRREINPLVYWIFIGSISMTIISEVLFTIFLDQQGVMIFTAHIFKVISYLLIYRGIVLKGLVAPYDLIFRELMDSNRELEIYNEKKNQFLGMAAHDLRNPLGLIMLYSKFLVEGTSDQLSDKYVKYLHRIQSSSEYMVQLVDDLLDIAKIEAGKLNLNLQPTDLIHVVENNINLNQPLAWGKKMNLVFEHEEEIPPVLVDSSKLEQVLNNLISNAIKYSYPESTVHVKLYKRTAEVILLVEDEGQGIPADEIDRIFNPFDKTSVKTTGGEKSTGLGLVITRKIVEGHQGQIWVESEVGKGTRFYVSIPLDQGQSSDIEMAN